MTSARYVPFTLTLQSPLLVTDIGGDPNSATSLGYIPGSAIRGVVARLLGDPDERPTIRALFDDLILSGRVRYLNCYPVVNETRAVPTPLSIHQEKDDPTCHYDLAAISESARPDPQLKQADAEFITIDTTDLRSTRVLRDGAVHQQRDRERGRAWKPASGDGAGVGAIYSYESLSPGQTFAGLLLIEGDAKEIDRLRREVTDLLSSEATLLLGRSRRSEYGGEASLAFHGTERSRELAVDVPAFSAGEELRCVLLSRYIGRDAKTGQPDPDAFAEEILRALNDRGVEAEIVRRFHTFSIAGGYNRKWRLQLPQMPAVEAGSVLVVRVKSNVSGDLLGEIEHRGVGERRIEGFGRIAFMTMPNRRVDLKESRRKRASDLPVMPIVPALVVSIETRIVRSRLEREVEILAASYAGSVAENEIPSASLLGRLRLAFRAAPDDGLAQMREWMGKESSTSLKTAAKGQLSACRLNANGKKTLADWLRDTAAEAAAPPGNIGVIAQQARLISEESATTALEELSVEMRARLIDATLSLLVRRRKLAE